MSPFSKSGLKAGGLIIGTVVGYVIAHLRTVWETPALSLGAKPGETACHRHNNATIQTCASSAFDDAMDSRFNRSAALVPFFDHEALNRSHFQLAACAEGGAHPFLFLLPQSSPMWSCDIPPTNAQVKVEMVMLHVFHQYCRPNPDKERGLMLDIGANAGYFGLLSMRMGCEALFFDLQRDCQTRINNAIVVNGFSRIGRVFPFGVASAASSFLSPSTGCDTRYPASAMETSNFGEGEHLTHVDRLGAFIAMDQAVALMKVDTEGSEQQVLAGARTFFQRRLIRNAIIEVTPGYGFWENVGVTREQVAETFREVAEFGYTMVSLHDWSIQTAPGQVYEYIKDAKFDQSDVWLTLDAVNKTTLDSILLLHSNAARVLTTAAS